jgi:hypothetical protein
MTITPLNAIPRAVARERRNSRRIQLLLPIEVEMEGEKCPGQLIELSRTGARISTKGARLGAPVVVRRAGAEVRGEVAWTNGLVAGVRFPEALDEKTFVQIRRRSIG